MGADAPVSAADAGWARTSFTGDLHAAGPHVAKAGASAGGVPVFRDWRSFCGGVRVGL